MTNVRVKMHGEMSLNAVPPEIGESAGAAVDGKLAALGGKVTCKPDRLVFDAFRPVAASAEDARSEWVMAVYKAFEKHGVHWTELSWTPNSYEVAEIHSS